MRDSTELMLAVIRMQIKVNKPGNSTMKRKRDACVLIHGELSTIDTIRKVL
jgi:hypothetical protein